MYDYKNTTQVDLVRAKVIPLQDLSHWCGVLLNKVDECTMKVIWTIRIPTNVALL